MDEQKNEFQRVLSKNEADEIYIKEFLSGFEHKENIQPELQEDIVDTPKCRDIIGSYKLFCEVVSKKLFRSIRLDDSFETNVEIIKNTLIESGIYSVEDLDKIGIYIYKLKKCILQRISYQRDCASVENYNNHIAAIDVFYRIYEGLKIIEDELSQSLFDEKDEKQYDLPDYIALHPLQPSSPIQEHKVEKKSHKKKRSKKKKSKQLKEHVVDDSYDDSYDEFEVGYYNKMYRTILKKGIVSNYVLYRLFIALVENFNTIEELADCLYGEELEYYSGKIDDRTIFVQYLESIFISVPLENHSDEIQNIPIVAAEIKGYVEERDFLTYNRFLVTMQFLSEAFNPENDVSITSKTVQIMTYTLILHGANDIDDEKHVSVDKNVEELYIKPLKYRIKNYLLLNRYYTRAINEGHEEILEYVYNYVYTNHFPETINYSLFSIQQTLHNFADILCNIKLDGRNWDFSYFFKKFYTNLFSEVYLTLYAAGVKPVEMCAHFDEQTKLSLMIEGIVHWKVLWTYILKCSMLNEDLPNYYHFSIALIFFNFVHHITNFRGFINYDIIVYHDMLIAFYLVQRGLLKKIDQGFLFSTFIKGKNKDTIIQSLSNFMKLSKNFIGTNEKSLEATNVMEDTLTQLVNLNLENDAEIGQSIRLLVLQVQGTIQHICSMVDNPDIKAITPALVKDSCIFAYINRLDKQTANRTTILYLLDMYPPLVPFFFTLGDLVEYAAYLVYKSTSMLEHSEKQYYIQYGFVDKKKHGNEKMNEKKREADAREYAKRLVKATGAEKVKR